jgi:prepilin-type N-terminal cleavage/methylation domain-containing protein
MNVANRRSLEVGFTLPELLMALAIGVTIMGFASAGILGLIKTTRAGGGLAEALAAFQSAREISISERRNMRMIFTSPNVIQIYRVEVPSGSTTLLRTIQLEGRVEFRTFPGIPDTPVAFGNSSAVSFGSTTPVGFTSDGSMIDANGDVLNGSLFLGVYGDPLSARAITVFGPTGALTQWVWDGRQWNER